MTEHPTIACRPIGVVRSRFQRVEGVPIQTAGAPGEAGSVEVFAAFEPGLKDIDGFEYLIVLTHLHLAAQERLQVVPFLDDVPHGVFATRAPARPNRIGLSIVRLTAVEGRTLQFSGNDMVDGTPVLDIKPYVPAFDVRNTARVGWFSAQLHKLPDARADDRMQ